MLDVRCSTFISFFFDQTGRFFGQWRRSYDKRWGIPLYGSLEGMARIYTELRKENGKKRLRAFPSLNNQSTFLF
jgi:hypothetical protein